MAELNMEQCVECTKDCNNKVILCAMEHAPVQELQLETDDIINLNSVSNFSENNYTENNNLHMCAVNNIDETSNDKNLINLINENCDTNILNFELNTNILNSELNSIASKSQKSIVNNVTNCNSEIDNINCYSTNIIDSGINIITNDNNCSIELNDIYRVCTNNHTIKDKITNNHVDNNKKLSINKHKYLSIAKNDHLISNEYTIPEYKQDNNNKYYNNNNDKDKDELYLKYLEILVEEHNNIRNDYKNHTYKNKYNCNYTYKNEYNCEYTNNDISKNNEILKFLENKLGSNLLSTLRIYRLRKRMPIEYDNNRHGLNSKNTYDFTNTFASATMNTFISGFSELSYKSSNINPIYVEPEITNEMRTRCIYILGMAYEHGLFGLKKTEYLAVRLYNYGFIGGCMNSTYSLARCYELGIGTRVCMSRAIDLYRVSYKMGHIKSLHRYACILIKGNKYLKQDVLAGLHLLRMAAIRADTKYPYPYYDLGMMYMKNTHYTIKDEEYAFQIFLTGAKLGCGSCQFRVAEMYENMCNIKNCNTINDVKNNVKNCTTININTDKYSNKSNISFNNINLAFLWHKKASENNQSDSQIRLSEMITAILEKNNNNSNGNIKNNEECLITNIHINSITDNNINIIPTINLHKLYGANVNMKEEAYKLAYLSALNGNLRALYFLGEAHERGFLCPKNDLHGLWYYRILVSLDEHKDDIIYKMAVNRIEYLEDKISGVKEREGWEIIKIVKKVYRYISWYI